MKKDTDWLKATIETIPFVASSTYIVGEVPDDAHLPFVVLHPQDGEDNTDRLSAPNLRRHPRWVIHSVGESYDQIALVAEAIKGALIVQGFGVVPQIDGEWTDRVWYSVPTSIQEDRDSTPIRLFHVAECGYASQTL